ncbi:hypothetical protein V7056_19235, partial [Bacillus sp. JJ664]
MVKESLKSFDWIKLNIDELGSTSPHWKGHFVSHCIPKRYSHYCKILHPIYRDKYINDDKLLWSQCHDNNEINIGTRLLYKDLAKKFHVKYTKEISTNTFINLLNGDFPRYIISPDDGDMEIKLVE